MEEEIYFSQLSDLEYASIDEAYDAMDTVVRDPCVDNYRFVFEDEDKGAYYQKYKRGCCGSFDAKIIVAGRSAMIGCNYGH